MLLCVALVSPGAAFSQQWCTDLPNGGHECCPSGTVLRPGAGCQQRAPLAPAIDPVTMTYDGKDDPAFLPVKPHTLEVLAAYVIDNGEGSGGVHGPEGNIYYDVFDCTEFLPAPPDHADERRIDGPRVLRGPDHTHGDVCEWGTDNEFLLYRNAGLFDWGPRECIMLRLWESDSRSEDGGWGRRNDVLGLEVIRRSRTMDPDGVWVKFHTYTNGHPRRRTGNIAVWLKLRTRPYEVEKRPPERGRLTIHRFVPAPLRRLCPDHVGYGDREFKGHGPKVTAESHLEIRHDATELWLVVELDAIETRKDFTQAHGRWELPLWAAPRGSVIQSVKPMGASRAFYVDRDHDLDVPPVTGSSLVRKFEIMGDTGGNDVGNCTADDVYMNVYFNEVYLVTRTP